MLGRSIRIACGLLVLLVGLAFHLKNHQTVTLDFYIAAYAMPLSWALVGALVCGVLLGALALAPGLLRARRRVHRLTRQARLATLAADKPGTQSGASNG